MKLTWQKALYTSYQRGTARLKVEQICLPAQIWVTNIIKPNNSSGNEKWKAIPYHHIPQSTSLDIICWKPVSQKVSACPIFVAITSSALVLIIRSMLLLYLHADAWNQTPVFYKFCLTIQYLSFVQELESLERTSTNNNYPEIKD